VCRRSGLAQWSCTPKRSGVLSDAVSDAQQVLMMHTKRVHQERQGAVAPPTHAGGPLVPNSLIQNGVLSRPEATVRLSSDVSISPSVCEQGGDGDRF
jgi:hypothetical protein